MTPAEFQSTPGAVVIVGESGGVGVSLQPPALAYRVATFRSAGLEAKWGRNEAGRPIILARKPGKKTWWVVTAGCWARAKVVGLWEAFDESILLGDIFFVSV